MKTGGSQELAGQPACKPEGQGSTSVREAQSQIRAERERETASIMPMLTSVSTDVTHDGGVCVYARACVHMHAYEHTHAHKETARAPVYS